MVLTVTGDPQVAGPGFSHRTVGREGATKGLRLSGIGVLVPSDREMIYERFRRLLSVSSEGL